MTGKRFPWLGLFFTAIAVGAPIMAGRSAGVWVGLAIGFLSMLVLGLALLVNRLNERLDTLALAGRLVARAQRPVDAAAIRIGMQTPRGEA